MAQDPKEAADFSFKDGKKLWSLVRRELALINKKRRWLASMIPGPDGCISPVKRPKLLKDVYLTESDIRSDEVSSERVKVNVERSFGSQCNCYNHHIVQDGMQLFNLQKGKDGSLCPGSLKIVHRTISELSNEALDSVANIATHNRISFEKIRPNMKKIIKDHLPKYLAELDNENAKSQLSKILSNPCNYQSNSVSLATPVSPILLSSINQALVGLNEMPEQALVAMNRKLREKSCPPRFLHVAQASTRSHLVSMINRRCRKIISELEEGNYLPKKLAKALSVMNLYRKLTLRCMDISQSEFFPFSRGTMSLQNDVLNALWSLPKVNHNDLKLLRPILGQGSKVEKMFFKVALKRYLIECLFECDEGNLPDEALRTIAFLIRMSPKRQQVILTEERKKEEVEAVLDLSSRLKSLAHCGTEGCPSDDEVSLGSDKCSEDNDFVLTETNYFNFGSQQQKMDEGCCSNIMTNTADTSVGGKDYVPEAEDSVSQLEEVLGRSCGRIEETGGVGHYRDSEAAGSMMEPHSTKVVGANNMKVTRCSEDLSVICDETATMAHKLVGQILKNMLLAENNEVDELTGGYLGGGSISQGPQAALAKSGGYCMVESSEEDIVLGYMAPEYMFHGSITIKSDIYSLGVIIMQMLTGSGHMAELMIENALGIWRCSLEPETSQRHTPLEIGYQQVKACIEISTSCTEHKPENRPVTGDIIRRLGETVDASGISTSPERSSVLPVPPLQASAKGTGGAALDKRKNFRLEATGTTGAKWCMLPSRSLQMNWRDTPWNWRWISLPNSRFAECMELLDVYWFVVSGEVAPKDLFAGTGYAAYLVYKLVAGGISGLEGRQTSSIRLYGERVVATSRVSLDPEARAGGADVTYPVARGDGWMELRLGEFANHGEMLSEKAVIVDIRDEDVRIKKSGLIVEGMEFRANHGEMHVSAIFGRDNN